MNESFKNLKTLSSELFDLCRIRELLGWDQEVYMPSGAAEGRGEQIATLSVLIHQKQSSSEMAKLLESSSDELNSNPTNYSDSEKALVRVMKRSYDHATKIPESFVSESNKIISVAIATWVQARKNNNYALYAPYLEKIVDLNIKQAEYLGYKEHPLDALLDLFEEGLKTKDIEVVFEKIKEPLIEILNECKNDWSDELHISPTMEECDQIEFSKKILTKIGFDFSRGRLDTTIHPFMTSLGHNDRRVTSRYNPNQVEFLFSALHEGGHALYEQGIGQDIARSMLDEGVSLGIHESQSRFWENIVGRSRLFWETNYTQLQEAFPEQFKKYSIDEFYKRINRVKPDFIRVDADELTYNLHILIRFEIEKAMIEGSLKVKDAPEVWRVLYKKYLGLDIPNDTVGILQDVHWAHGTIGYFATYTLGNLASAQIWNTYKKHDPAFRETIRSGNLEKVRLWLCENIYQHGSVYKPDELILRISGESLNPNYLIEYLREKYIGK
ncbi:MAG: carboxypeptidase M32 [bacterium]|nr:carboxypeptidase M32 [bacterium]